MSENLQLINVAVETYHNLLINITKMFNYTSNEFNKSYDDLLTDTNHYIQSLLFKVAISDKTVKCSEFKFIHKISENDDIFKEYNIEGFDHLDKDTQLEIISSVDKILDECPSFVELSVIADKKADLEMKILKPTHCQIVYDSLVRIANYLKFVDDDVLKVEDDSAREELKPVVLYYKSKYVKYAPSRSNN